MASASCVAQSIPITNLNQSLEALKCELVTMSFEEACQRFNNEDFKMQVFELAKSDPIRKSIYWGACLFWRAVQKELGSNEKGGIPAAIVNAAKSIANQQTIPNELADFMMNLLAINTQLPKEFKDFFVETLTLREKHILFECYLYSSRSPSIQNLSLERSKALVASLLKPKITGREFLEMVADPLIKYGILSFSFSSDESHSKLAGPEDWLGFWFDYIPAFVKEPQFLLKAIKEVCVEISSSTSAAAEVNARIPQFRKNLQFQLFLAVVFELNPDITRNNVQYRDISNVISQLKIAFIRFLPRIFRFFTREHFQTLGFLSVLNRLTSNDLEILFNSNAVEVATPSATTSLTTSYPSTMSDAVQMLSGLWSSSDDYYQKVAPFFTKLLEPELQNASEPTPTYRYKLYVSQMLILGGVERLVYRLFKSEVPNHNIDGVGNAASSTAASSAAFSAAEVSTSVYDPSLKIAENIKPQDKVVDPRYEHIFLIYPEVFCELFYKCFPSINQIADSYPGPNVVFKPFFDSLLSTLRRVGGGTVSAFQVLSRYMCNPIELRFGHFHYLSKFGVFASTNMSDDDVGRFWQNHGIFADPKLLPTFLKENLVYINLCRRQVPPETTLTRYSNISPSQLHESPPAYDAPITRIQFNPIG